MMGARTTSRDPARRRRWAALAAAVLVLGACGAGAPQGTWTVTSSQGMEIVEGTEPSVRIEAGSISISTGCNHLTGAVRYSDGVLRAQELASTLIGCEAELHDQEDRLGAFFSGGAELELDGETMTLTQGEVTLTLTRTSSP